MVIHDYYQLNHNCFDRLSGELRYQCQGNMCQGGKSDPAIPSLLHEGQDHYA